MSDRLGEPAGGPIGPSPELSVEAARARPGSREIGPGDPAFPGAATAPAVVGPKPPPFRSILFEGASSLPGLGERSAPPYFSDLNLDQVVAAITAGREEYDLAPFFQEHLEDPATIQYRHGVLRDLEGGALPQRLTSFAQGMREMRAQLAQAGKLRYQRQQESWFLAAVETYCAAVSCLARDLVQVELASQGMLTFGEYLSSYVASPEFTALTAETGAVKDALARVGYCVQVQGNRVAVSKYAREPDYSQAVLSTFEKFKQRGAKDYRVAFPNWPEMNHVEAAVLDLVVRLYPDVFAGLQEFCARHRDFVDATCRRFDREVQFYLAYLDHMDRFTPLGLRFNYPEVTRQSKEVFATDTFDLALANKLVAQDQPVVGNDFYLNDPERIFVVSGPNQGGKTTFARTFGQLHHLASIGLPVPGSGARLFLFDRMFTHFERQEVFADLRGKLEDDLVRIRDGLDLATENSIIVMNEIFTSTTLKDARWLGTKVLEEIIELDALCVYVSFVDELASLDQSVVSMVSTVAPENPAERTYKVLRRPADGLAYAIAIAEKYGLTYPRLRARIPR
ncbi:MAG: MutS-related protein [Candidatus Dormibacteria bacterium]